MDRPRFQVIPLRQELSSAKMPRRIRLVLTDGGDGNNFDWADWAEAGLVVRRD